MNYSKIYSQLIFKAKNREITKYTENHHIIPKCLGGNNDIENLVKLTFREHYIAHWLLCKMYKENLKKSYKLGCAFLLMSKSNNGKRITNSKFFDKARMQFKKSQIEFYNSTEGIFFLKERGKTRSQNRKNLFSYHFYHETYGDFLLPTIDLVELFPEQKLNSSNLVKVGKEERPSTKGWILFKNKDVGVSGFLKKKKEKMSNSAKSRQNEVWNKGISTKKLYKTGNRL
jgi:hypothetical protein